MYELRFAPQPTDLRPRRLAEVASYDHGELDSYALEEEELLFAAWCAEVDDSDPPF